MNIEGSKLLVLGGSGLVGMAVCRQLVARTPQEIQIHSLQEEEAEATRRELEEQRNGVAVSTSSGDIFSLTGETTQQARIQAQLGRLEDKHLPDFLLYRLLTESKPDIVIDCVNTATAIAYKDMYRAAENLTRAMQEKGLEVAAVNSLLESLYVPRLIRHIQVLYRGMKEAGTRVYIKVGTSGTGGMGLNIPYTHSEERPSRMLLSKSAVAGAHSMLLFLMARTPGAPITKEIKPAAAIAWKRIAHGPIYRRGEPIRVVHAAPRPLGKTFSSFDPEAAADGDRILEAVFIDTGENGIFSVEEFAALTTARQMEFVTPEEIAQSLIFEIEGGNSGFDVINALDNAVMGPTYRAGLLRHWALERMNEIQKEHGTNSVAFEMLGPPRISKLLFEAHLLHQAFGTMTAVRKASAEDVAEGLNKLVREQPDLANEVVSVGIPILMCSGELIRGPRVLIPSEVQDEPIDTAKLEAWTYDGWVDLRPPNCQRWIERFQKIHQEVESIPRTDSSSRYLRTERFWDGARRIQPGKIVGWILSVEEEGGRVKR